MEDIAFESTSERPFGPLKPRPPIIKTKLHLEKDSQSFSPKVSGVVEAPTEFRDMPSSESCFFKALSQ